MAKMYVIDSIEKTDAYMRVMILGESYEMDPFLIMKYKLKVGSTLDSSTFKQLIDDQQMVFYDHFALKKLKKMLTVHELKTLLSEKGCKKHIIDQLINRYIKHKYLDDLAYAKMFIQSKKNTYGPLVLSERLRQKGITEHILNLAFVGYDGYEILMNMVEKKAKSIKQKSMQDAKRTLYQSFVQKGFTHEMVSSVLSNLNTWYDVDTKALINKQYNLYFIKFSKTNDQQEAHHKAVNKLLQKGFSYQDIKDSLEKML